MSIMERYARYFAEVCAGRRAAPEHFAESEHPAQAMAELVRRCAAEDGEEIPESEWEEFDPAQVERLLRETMAEQPDASPQPDAPPEVKIEEPDGPRSACEVLLDCCLLSGDLFTYLVHTLKTGDGAGFFRLSQVTTRQSIPPEEFLRWLGTKERYAPEEERACAVIMDSVLARLEREGELELLAALLSGDRTTFELYRCEAPELVHLPQATYAWYEKNYLNQYYPVRFMMRRHGVVFPEMGGCL